MVTKVQKWGGGQGLRLSRELLKEARLSLGDEVEVAVRDGVIVVAPLERPRSGHTLQELVTQIPEDYQEHELDWGSPVGKEVW